MKVKKRGTGATTHLINSKIVPASVLNRNFV